MKRVIAHKDDDNAEDLPLEIPTMSRLCFMLLLRVIIYECFPRCCVSKAAQQMRLNLFPIARSIEKNHFTTTNSILQCNVPWRTPYVADHAVFGTIDLSSAFVFCLRRLSFVCVRGVADVVLLSIFVELPGTSVTISRFTSLDASDNDTLLASAGMMT